MTKLENHNFEEVTIEIHPWTPRSSSRRTPSSPSSFATAAFSAMTSGAEDGPGKGEGGAAISSSMSELDQRFTRSPLPVRLILSIISHHCFYRKFHCLPLHDTQLVYEQERFGVAWGHLSLTLSVFVESNQIRNQIYYQIIIILTAFFQTENHSSCIFVAYTDKCSPPYAHK